MKRQKTDYRGVFFREVRRIGGRGGERVYYVVYKKDGKVIEEKAGSQFRDKMTPAQAASYRAQRIEGKRPSKKEIREAAKKATEAAKTAPTFTRLWAAYLEDKPDLKGKAFDSFRFEKYLRPLFGDKEPKDLLPLDVDRLRLKILKGKSPQTIKLSLSLLTRIVNFGVRKKLCLPITFKVEMPKVHNYKTEDLAPDQLKALLNSIEKDTHPQAGTMMKMALFTGMRRGELFKLKWSDIDFDRGFIRLRDPKGGPDQNIPLNDAAREALSGHIKAGSPYVFPGRGGQRRTDINKAVNDIKKRANLPKDFRPLHGLRHVYASVLASSGKVDMYTLQKLLTHKDPRMTQRYAHLRDDALKKASNLVGELISEATATKEKVEKRRSGKSSRISTKGSLNDHLN